MRYGGTTTKFLLGMSLVVAVVAILVPRQARSAPCRPDCKAEAVIFVQQLADKVGQILENEDGRSPRLNALILESVRFDRIAKYALGRSWNIATRDQRIEYQRLFTQSMLFSVTDRVRAYRGTKIDVVDQYAISKSDTVVITKMTPLSGEQSRMGWRVSATDSGPAIVDVLIRGASMLVTKRHEFSAVAAQRGLTGVIVMLRRLVARQSGQNRSSAAVVDFKALEAGLRRTKAIGFMTKVRMSFEASGLIERAKRYRKGRSNVRLGGLRAKFDSLLGRTVAKLARGGDLTFSRALENSRLALWRELISDGPSTPAKRQSAQFAFSDHSVE